MSNNSEKVKCEELRSFLEESVKAGSVIEEFLINFRNSAAIKELRNDKLLYTSRGGGNGLTITAPHVGKILIFGLVRKIDDSIIHKIGFAVYEPMASQIPRVIPLSIALYKGKWIWNERMGYGIEGKSIDDLTIIDMLPQLLQLSGEV